MRSRQRKLIGAVFMVVFVVVYALAAMMLAQVTALLERIAALPIAVLPIDAPRAFDHILPVARQQSLSGYDAAYLDLALRQGLPLATLDEQLRRAAKTTGVVLLS